METIKYSLVIPVYNEEESINPLAEEIHRVMEDLQVDYEIVFVNDGSTDSSPQKLKELQRQKPDNIRVITLSQRRGQSYALRRGLDEACGDIIITLDADLQNDPADIPKLLAKMNEGYDVVCGWRRDRHDPGLKKRLSRLGNILQRLFTGLRIHDISCTLRAYRKECAQKIPLDWEGQHRFIPLVLAKQGYKIGEITAHHRRRTYGVSKYTHKRIFRVVYDFFRVMFTNYNKKMKKKRES